MSEVPDRRTRIRKWIRRCVRLLGLLVVVCVVLIAVAAVYCRMDKTEVFLDLRGGYGGARELEAWSTAVSLVRRVALRNDRGEELAEAYLRRPQRLEGNHHILLAYVGRKTGARILELLPERDDLVLIAVQYPYESPRRRGLLAYLRWPRDVRRAAFRTVSGGMLALDFLEREERLDPSRVTLVGASVGAPFATIHGALDERVPRVLIIHGGGDFPTIIRAARWEQGWVKRPAIWVAAIVIDTFDPVHWANRIAPRELVMIATRHDRYFPVESVQALYDCAGEPKTLLWTETDHVRSRRTDALEEVLLQVEGYLETVDHAPPTYESAVDGP